MAMSVCRECGKEVSTEARTCPFCGCGHPTTTNEEHQKSTSRKVRNIILAIVFSIIGVGIIVGLISLVSHSFDLQAGKRNTSVLVQEDVSIPNESVDASNDEPNVDNIYSKKDMFPADVQPYIVSDFFWHFDDIGLNGEYSITVEVSDPSVFEDVANVILDIIVAEAKENEAVDVIIYYKYPGGDDMMSWHSDNGYTGFFVSPYIRDVDVPITSLSFYAKAS